MRKELLTFFMLLAWPIGMLSVEVNALVVLTSDNVEHEFVLIEEKPQISFIGTDLVVNCVKTATTVSFALSDVVNFTYKKVEVVGIENVRDPETSLSYEGGTLVIAQLQAGKTVTIYSVDGRQVQQLKADRTGTYRLNLSSLPYGVYVVKSGSLTYKIMKR